MVATRRLTELIGSVAARLRLPDGPVVVGLSGGADSAALAYLCVETGREIRALHVNHGLAHSMLMQKAALSVAEELGIDLEIVNVSVPEGPSPEGRAREARYEAFSEAAGNAPALLTAHTVEDNAETILLNLIRGSGPRGLSGIPYNRAPNIYRPSLGISRSETREIASLAGLSYIDDPMNDDPSLTRNWLRNTILPRLAEQNPRIVESIRRAGEAIGRDVQYLDGLARLQSPTLGDSEAKHPRASLLAAPGPVADRVVMEMLGHVIGQSAVTADRVSRVWAVVLGDSASQEVGLGAVARLLGPTLVIAGERSEGKGAGGPLRAGLNRFGTLIFEVRSVDRVCRVAPLSVWAAIFPKTASLSVGADGVVLADGEPAWVPGQRRLPVAWYEAGDVGYLLVLARERTGWT